MRHCVCLQCAGCVLWNKRSWAFTNSIPTAHFHYRSPFLGFLLFIFSVESKRYKDLFLFRFVEGALSESAFPSLHVLQEFVGSLLVSAHGMNFIAMGSMCL